MTSNSTNKQKLTQFYKAKLAGYQNELTRLKKGINRLSILRLASIALAFFFLIFTSRTGNAIFLAFMGISIISFFVLVSINLTKTNQKSKLQQLVRLNQQEIDCIKFSFYDHPDGDEHKDNNHPWTYDLDVFGSGSIYQYLNRTATHTGPSILASFLSESCLDPKLIKNRQLILQELSNKTDFRQTFTALARNMQVREEDFHEVIAWTKKSNYIKKYPILKILARIMSVVSIGVISTAFFIPEYFILMVPVAVINWLLLAPFLARTNLYQDSVSKKHSFLKTYAQLIDLISEESFHHPDLEKIRHQCSNGAASIRKLSQLLNFFDQRLNMIAGILLNSLFLYDFHMVEQLAKWTDKNADQLETWLRSSNHIDAYNSLAGFVFNHPEFCFPKFDQKSIGLIAKDLGHPMIHSEKRVDNSIEITKEKVMLITGANMAGKSTFLRAIGINYVLCYAGCPVCASEFTSAPYKLFSSMRTADSLKDDESYFFAEIKRLKKIVDQMESGEQLLMLLDEVLKGTNTTDKQRGSRGLIEKTINYDVLCFIATHDLALGDLENQHPEKVVNYCFESYIQDLELSFDYTINKGLAKNMNASFLMKKMGIMD